MKTEKIINEVKKLSLQDYIKLMIELKEIEKTFCIPEYTYQEQYQETRFIMTCPICYSKLNSTNCNCPICKEIVSPKFSYINEPFQKSKTNIKYDTLKYKYDRLLKRLEILERKLNNAKLKRKIDWDAIHKEFGKLGFKEENILEENIWCNIYNKLIERKIIKEGILIPSSDKKEHLQKYKTLSPYCTLDEWYEVNFEIFELDNKWTEPLRLLLLYGINIKNAVEMIPKIKDYIIKNPMKPIEAAGRIGYIIHEFKI